jgi:hypothetical protein
MLCGGQAGRRWIGRRQRRWRRPVHDLYAVCMLAYSIIYLTAAAAAALCMYMKRWTIPSGRMPIRLRKDERNYRVMNAVS